MDFHAAGFFCLCTSYGARGPVSASAFCWMRLSTKKRTGVPVLVKKVERSSTMDDIGVFGIVAQAVDGRETDGSSEAAALPVGAR